MGGPVRARWALRPGRSRRFHGVRAHTQADAGMAAEKLVEAALTRKADDNITAMVVLLRPIAPDASARQRPRLPFMKRAASVPAALSAGVAAAPG